MPFKQQTTTNNDFTPQLHALLVIATYWLRIPPDLPINDKTKGTQNKNIKNQLGDNAAQ